MPDAYSAALATGSTTLCRCFRLTRRDGAVFGFTDHDRPVEFDGLVYAPETALTASDAAASLGMAPDELDAAGALSADAITAVDLAAGLYDGAAVQIFDVDWKDPAARRLMGRYTVGQTERGPVAFRAELRSLSAGLDRKVGRVHTSLCDVRRLGDHRCKLALGPWQSAGTVVGVEDGGRALIVEGASGFDPAILARGIATFADGSAHDIRAAHSTSSGWGVALWRAPAAAVAIGSAVTLTAGCDRTAATCSGRFGNLNNFRGFPHMPGDNVTADYAVPGDADLDGGSRFSG